MQSTPVGAAEQLLTLVSQTVRVRSRTSIAWIIIIRPLSPSSSIDPSILMPRLFVESRGTFHKSSEDNNFCHFCVTKQSRVLAPSQSICPRTQSAANPGHMVPVFARTLPYIFLRTYAHYTCYINRHKYGYGGNLR